MAITFEDFLMAVPEEHQSFVSGLHERLTDQGCNIVIKEAKRGYAVSYKWENKTIMNWVFRKSGVLARIYGDHVGKYETAVVELPPDMQAKMTNARDCKKLFDQECSDTCVAGLVYNLNGETYKKCRNDGMFFLLSDETALHIQKLVFSELSERQASA